jgi:hypothetical protein
MGGATDAVLSLGARRDGSGGAVELPSQALLRHVMALGSSGSGKTVFCKVLVEEAVLAGVPVIAVDPQGDLCSLALPAEEPSALQGVLDVVLFTPASRRGVPLSADPVGAGDARLPAAERVRALTRTAGRITSLLGYDLDSDDGAGLVAVFDRCLAEMAEEGRPPQDLRSVIDRLEQLGAGLERYARYLDPKKIHAACQRAARLDVGARRLLFHDGLPIDIEVLLGKKGPLRTPAGKTRVAVIYLNTLDSQEDKEFVVATLADRMVAWMMANPSPTLQAMLYIDEVAPFVPPVRKPACKDDLQILFKQARKFGVGCVMATQNPGDVDYKAMGQFGTWALGRLATRQDLKKIEPSLRSLTPDAATILEELPSLRPGELVLLAPDSFPAPCPLATRRLHTPHRTLDEEAIERLSAPWRDRVAAPPRKDKPVVPLELDATIPVWGHPEVRQPEQVEVRRPKRARAKPAPPLVDDEPPMPAPGTLFPTTTPGGDESQVVLDKNARILAARSSMTAQDFARRARVGERAARSALRGLVAAGLAGEYREGRAAHYFARATGGRPDLGMKGRVLAVEPRLDRLSAETIGRGKARSKLLGLGEEESFEDATLVYRLVYRVAFHEKVKRHLIGRLIGPSHEERLGTLYLHPSTFDVLELSKESGLRFSSRPADRASDVEDLDGVARFIEVRPGDIPFEEEDWKVRRTPAEAKKRVRELFAARPGAVDPLFVPLWRLVLRRGAGVSYRVVTVDSLIGRPIEWPEA